MAITYKKCQQVSLVETENWSTEVEELCIQISNGTFSDGTRPCESGSTPQLTSINLSLFQHSYNSYSDYLTGSDGTIGVSMGVWIGLDESTGCLWIGQQESGICVNECSDNGDYKIEALEALGADFLSKVEKYYQDSKYDILTTIGVTVAIALIVAACLLLLPELGLSVSGGSIGAGILAA